MSEEMTREQAITYFQNRTAFVDGKEKQACEIAILAIAALSAEPCEDAISRQAVMDCFKKWQPYMATRLWEFEKELSALPFVNPQPKTGHWEWVQYDSNPNVGNWHCSECRTIIPHMPEETDNTPIYKWCPMCGAKMVQPQESEEV